MKCESGKAIVSRELGRSNWTGDKGGNVANLRYRSHGSGFAWILQGERRNTRNSNLKAEMDDMNECRRTLCVASRPLDSRRAGKTAVTPPV